MPAASFAHVGDNRGGLPSPALATELTKGQSYWHKAWGRGQSRTRHEGLRMGQGGHLCFLRETTANHFHPIPFLITDAKGDKCPHPLEGRGDQQWEIRELQEFFGDGSPMPCGRGRGAGLFLHQSWPVTSEFPTPF